MDLAAPAVNSENTHRVTLMETTDFGFLALVAPDWAFQMMSALASSAPKPVQRLHTNYYPKAERTAANALAYRSGLKVAPRRSTAADKALAEARAWGLAS